jgi:YidC/Oxa1 family membrane protein insertase
MDQEKRNLILALALCAGIFGIWQYTMVPRHTPPVAPVATKTQPTGEPGSATTGDVPAEGSAAGTAGAPISATAPEQSVTLENEHTRYVFTDRGATLKQAFLKGEKFAPAKGDRSQGLEISRGAEATKHPFLVSFPGSGFQLPESTIYRVAESSQSHVVFVAEADGVAIRKTFRLRGERYRLSLEVAVENHSSGEQKHNLVLHLFGQQNPATKGGGFFDYATASVTEMACLINDDIERNSVDALVKEKYDEQGVVRWIAADERFFTLAAVPPAQGDGGGRKCGQRVVQKGDEVASAAEIFVALGEAKVAPQKSLVYPFELYVGPKYRIDLTAVMAAPMAAGGQGQPAELDRVVNVSFAFLSRPMLALLKMFFGLTQNWGLAIILLTILVRMVTFYPTHKQLVSGKKMARLGPKMAELRKKYGDDRERMGRETMNLYKTAGVNPLGGCLPALIQMPIWIALFSTLSYSVELYRADLGLHIHDLSAPDPFYISPLAMGVVMFLQMRMAPPGADPAQQKMMAIMMPIMFTGFQLFLPAGLAVYMLTSYLIGILHQLWVNHLDRKDNGPIESVPAPVQKS